MEYLTNSYSIRDKLFVRKIWQNLLPLNGNCQSNKLNLTEEMLENRNKQAGAELCQAQIQLELGLTLINI